VAAYISNALNGTDGEETWEDFEQTIVSDARLESIRKQAIAVKWPLDKVGRDKFEGLLLQLKKLAMTEASPTALEMAVLRDLCRRLPPQDRAALEEQIIGISVLNRRNTGAGFFTYFILTEKSSNRITVDVKGYPTRANIDDTENALGFILWLKNGYVDYLEGYTEALDSTHGMDLAALKFEINGH
jgi:hypothetical protein